LQEEYILCRCGRSLTKPFCDGTHSKINFTGKESARREPYITQAEENDGPDLRLTDALIFCASARFCDRAGGIWDLTMQSKAREAKGIAIEEAGNCPSGRLVVWDKTTKEAIEPAFEPSIGIVEYPQEGLHGPIWVRGGIPIESATGILYEIRNRVTLCRCGHSFNKPFCDSSHLRWSGNRPLRPSTHERRE
jgi:CDGSH-type Zn-finger protein